MHTHANARLTQRGWLRLVSQYLPETRPLPELVAETGISRRRAYKWLARDHTGGAAALVDRQAAGRSILHRGQGAQPPGFRAVAVFLA